MFYEKCKEYKSIRWEKSLINFAKNGLSNFHPDIAHDA